MVKKKHVKLACSISWCKLDCGVSLRFLLLWSWLVPWAQFWSSAATTDTRRVSKREMSGWTKVASKSKPLFPFSRLFIAPVYNWYANKTMKYYSGMNLLENDESILQTRFPSFNGKSLTCRGRFRSAATEVKLQVDFAKFPAWFVPITYVRILARVFRTLFWHMYNVNVKWLFGLSVCGGRKNPPSLPTKSHRETCITPPSIWTPSTLDSEPPVGAWVYKNAPI